MAKRFVCTPDHPVVQTTAGKIRGFELDGVFHFFGVPYAHAERFQAPHPIPAWEGIRNTLSYGAVCPLMSQEPPNKEELVPHRYWYMDENCQNLNLWSPTLTPEARKPVMVWLHGGGFTAGSAIEHVAYEGDNMSRYGDVVVVTVNHRLNLLGYLDLSAFGDKYRNSANVGNEDLVAALSWIQENIAAFGGDPDNVTIFGQSGGGEKVLSLMNTPAADGLFHKAIVESGVTDLSCGEMTDGKPLVLEMLSELGISEAEVEKLEKIPYQMLVDAYLSVIRKKGKLLPYIGNWVSANSWYKGCWRDIGFTDHAKTIPLLVGSVMGEFCFEPGVKNKYTLERTEIMPLIEKKYGRYANTLVPLFETAYPGKNLSDLLYVDTYFRTPTKKMIQKRTETGCAPTYAYQLTYDFPIDGGKVAWHCSEIPFVFHNTSRTPLFNVPGETDQLQERIFGAFINFARYGSPQFPSIPAWPECQQGREATMIFDKECTVRVNFDDQLQEELKASGATAYLSMMDCLIPESEGSIVVH